ncbi:hypothetical protein AX15_002214 [Amanita polypyramis BW_CC]|nr:hypothetical protein AX15_002214 [Amanita polypyramis BW_CC]
MNMSTAFTSALIQAREVLDRRRGQSNDSGETDDSPFGSSLATPADANDLGVTHAGTLDSASSALRFLVSPREDSSPVDYFGFKKGGQATLSRALGLRARSRSLVEQTPSSSGRASAQISPGCSMPGTPAEETLMRKRSIYNLPNRPIEVQARLEQSASEGDYALDGTVSRDSSIWDDDGEGSSLENQSLVMGDATFGSLLDCAFANGNSEYPLWFLRPANFSSEDLITPVARVVCFIPWCIVVGGTMLLWPDQLEVIAFQAGYVDSMKGIRRFAHWADVGLYFVMIFFAFLATVLWFLPGVAGVTLAVCLCSRFVLVWHGCELDFSVPLGNDDRQSLYLVATMGERGLLDGRAIAKTDAGFMVVPEA